MSADPKLIVAAGYDAMADRYAGWIASIEDDPRDAWLDRLDARLPRGATVLELGCGGGGPSTRRLAARYRLTGVDISAEQIARARAAVPEATFLHSDFTALDLAPSSFDAVVALYVLNHVPRDEQTPLLRAVAGWLRPGGSFLTTFGIGGSEDAIEDDWLGVPMFFASFDPVTNRRMVEAAGFEILAEETPKMLEPGYGPARFQWILARTVADLDMPR